MNDQIWEELSKGAAAADEQLIADAHRRLVHDEEFGERVKQLIMRHAFGRMPDELVETMLTFVACQLHLAQQGELTAVQSQRVGQRLFMERLGQLLEEGYAFMSVAQVVTDMAYCFFPEGTEAVSDEKLAAWLQEPN